MESISLPYRANLGNRLLEIFQTALNRINAGLNYFTNIELVVSSNKQQDEFFRSTFLIGIVSILESYISDSTLSFLCCFPGKLPDKNIKLDDIANSGSIKHVIDEISSRFLHELIYKSLPEIITISLSFFDKKAALDSNLIADITEIKCTRDVYVHSNGSPNETYLRKTGDKSRAEPNKKLDLSNQYLKTALSKIKNFIQSFHQKGPSKFLHYNKTETFRKMWEQTCLSKRVQFDEAWLMVENDDLVRPIDKEYFWSHSEKGLYDFFLRIYSDTSPKITTDFMYGLYKWSSKTPEGKIMRSWIDDPFWF